MFRIPGCFALWLGLSVSAGLAQEVRITQNVAFEAFDLNGKNIVIERIQDTSNRLNTEFTKTSRPCPPFCIHPMSAAPGVVTVGEIEVIEFLKTRVVAGEGLLIDSRMPEWFAKGTIPGAVNVPFTTLEPANPFRDEILRALGATQGAGGWDFSGSLELLMFCNGPWCDQSPRAIRDLTTAGYPPEKISYYRGGMQVWTLLGLTVRTQ